MTTASKSRKNLNRKNRPVRAVGGTPCSLLYAQFASRTTRVWEPIHRKPPTKHLTPMTVAVDPWWIKGITNYSAQVFANKTHFYLRVTGERTWFSYCERKHGLILTRQQVSQWYRLL